MAAQYQGFKYHKIDQIGKPNIKAQNQMTRSINAVKERKDKSYETFTKKVIISVPTPKHTKPRSNKRRKITPASPDLEESENRS